MIKLITCTCSDQETESQLIVVAVLELSSSVQCLVPRPDGGHVCVCPMFTVNTVTTAAVSLLTNLTLALMISKEGGKHTHLTYYTLATPITWYQIYLAKNKSFCQKNFDLNDRIHYLGKICIEYECRTHFVCASQKNGVDNTVSAL